jgi:hemolysin activation/secretion protein
MWIGMRATAFLAAVLSAATGVQAAALPGPADAGRMDQREGLGVPEQNPLLPVQPMQSLPAPSAPQESKKVTVELKDVRIEGMTVFQTSDINDIYKPYLGHEVTLDTVWVMAGQLTERYHNAGYFLSRAVVPQQEIKDGIVVLHVVEGCIGEVAFDDPLAQNWIIKQWLDKLLSYRPIRADQIESVLLHLSDLPGVDLRAVLQPIDGAESAEGSVRLVLERKETPVFSGSLSFDNYGSRFLGPYEVQKQAQVVYWPTQKTTASLVLAFPLKQMTYASVKHELPVFAGGTLELYGSYSTAAPGYTLKPEEIRTFSPTLGTAVDYSIIRQRQENLTGRITLEMHNTHTDILGTPLTDDDIRAARFNLNYQKADDWNGQTMLDATLSEGLPFLGANHPGQLNLSRAEARPDFTKFNLSASRLQNIVDAWDVYAATSGQLASGPLYSAEQFGYGGQAFGRAYDDSEITGDEGIAASAELRYSGFGPWHGIQPIPYQFYDTGAVWNGGQNPTTPYAAGSSAGAGFRVLSEYGLSGNAGFAFPLTRRIANPLEGNGKNPRYFLQISYGF